MGLKIALSLAVMVSIAGCPGGSSSTAVAQSYYVDATNGNDLYGGNSESAPWKTLGKVSNSSFQTGTTIYLKRGETWYEQLDIPSSGVSVDAYGSGALPVIDGSVDIGNTGWAAHGGDVYSESVTVVTGEGLGNVSESGTLLNFVAWNSSCSTTLASAANGSYSYAYPNLVCLKVATNPNIIANINAYPYRASKKLYGISAISKTNISIKNVQIQRFSLNGVNLKDCATCTVSSVMVKQGGGAVIASSLYAGNGVECDNDCSNILIDNVTVSDIFDSGISPQTYDNNKTASSITIQNSTVDKAGFAGVEISVLSNVGKSGSSISSVTVSGLTITNSGKGWSGRRYSTEGHGIRIKADAGAGTMSNVLVKDTIISGSAGDGIKLGGQIGTVTINRAKIKTSNIGVNVADASATTLKLVLTTSLIYNNNSNGVLFDVPLGAGFNLYHNTFYDNSRTDVDKINFKVLNQAGEAKLQNNLFYSSAAMTHLYVRLSLLNGLVNNNCYNNQTNMFGYNSSVYSTVADFRVATTFEASGVGGSSVNLTNAAAEIFTLLAGSQCISSGASGLGVPLDYVLYNYATPPSSGAYQYH